MAKLVAVRRHGLVGTLRALALSWAAGAPGFPFGEHDPQGAAMGSVLFAVPAKPTGLVMAGWCGAALIVAGAMRRPTSHRRRRRALLAVAWCFAITMLLVILDIRLLQNLAYGLLFVFVKLDWPVLKQGVIVLGGLFWAMTAIGYRRKHAGASPGHSEARVAVDRHWALVRWGKAATYAAFLLPLPYGITRLAWALGIPLGLDQDLSGIPLTARIGEAGLATLAIGGGTVTLGLIRPWGEIWPRWIPRRRDRDRAGCRVSSQAGNPVLRPTSTRQAAESGRQPVSRWIKAAAYAVPLCVLPSALWRLWALADGLPPGCRQAMQGWEPYYITGLSVVSFGAALLTIGLVRPWGEVVPRWIPLVGGRTVPVRAAVTAAGLGATLIFGVYAYALVNPIFRFRVAPDDPGCPSPLEGPGAWVAVASYAPLLAWGPLLVVVTVAYYRRRSHTTTVPSRTDRSSKLQAAG